MSLKAFHVFFIVAAILLALWVTAWGLTGGGGSWAPLLGVAAAVVAVGLVIYLVNFLKKMKDVSSL